MQYTSLTMVNQFWFSTQVSLSGVLYTLEFRYNNRMDRWFMNVLSAAGQTILTGIPLTVNVSLTGQYRAYSVPPGYLFVVDFSGKNLPPGLTSFLTTHKLIYGDPTG